jgi:conjugative transposon TraM protein
MGNLNLKEVLKDKNKLLMLVPLLLGVLFVIVFFGKKEKSAEPASTEEVNQAFLEPDAEGEKKVANKVDAYKREQEEADRKKRELEKSQVKGSDFYFEMQSSEDEYNEKMKDRIEKMQKDPLDEVTSEYKERGTSSNSPFSDKMRRQLNDIEDQETFNQIVREAKKEERIRKEIEESAMFQDEMRKKYQAQLSGKDIETSQEDIFPKVNDSVPEVERASKPTFIVENGKRRRRPLFLPDRKVNLVKAAIYGDQTIVSGSAVRMRLLEPLWVGGVEIPANTIFYGNASVGSSRLKITVENIRYGKYISPVAFIIYDSDAIEGLNLPNNMKAEAARKMESGLLQGVQLPISSIGTVTSEVTSAITATTQVARQILNQSLSQVKVHLKANYTMYIKEETNEDRKKREEEEAEIERLYREMQMQQNEPKKKNPLTQLIDAL